MKYTRSPIHWRGYPHHRWPRIRLPKRKGSRSTQSASSIDNKLKKRRALQRARQNKEVFGWQSPLPGSRSKATTPDAVLMVVPSSLTNNTDGADSPNPRNRSPAEVRYQKKVIANHATTAKRNPSGIAIPKSVDFGKKQTYDPRIDYKQHSRPKSPSKDIPISPSIRSFVHSLISVRSRTLSQRKALRRFTKELELHLQAVENLRGKSLIPSPSTTMVSIKTIQELMPYYEQFKSAGLAVTGAEQRERSLRKPNRMPPNVPEEHQRAPKKDHLHVSDIEVLDGSGRISHASSYTLSSSHTILGWTPPHEQPPESMPVRPSQASVAEVANKMKTTKPLDTSSRSTSQRSRKPRPSVAATPGADDKLSMNPPSTPSPKTNPKPVHKSQASKFDAAYKESLTQPNVSSPKTTKAPNIIQPANMQASDIIQPIPRPNGSTRSSIPWLRKQSTSPRKPSIASTLAVDDDSSIVTIKTYPRQTDVKSRQYVNATTQTSTSLSRYIDAEQSMAPRLTKDSEKRGQLTNRTPLVAEKPLFGQSQMMESPEDASALEMSEIPESMPTLEWMQMHPFYGISIQPPMGDPVKRTPPTNPKVTSTSTISSNDEMDKYMEAKSKTALPPVPTVLDVPAPKNPRNATQSLSTTDTASSSLGSPQKEPKVCNADTFRGLQVATAAACDEDLDRWITEVAGIGVRRFLAGLSLFDDLGVNALSDVARRAAKQRRTAVRAWERVKEERMKEQKK